MSTTIKPAVKIGERESVTFMVLLIDVRVVRDRFKHTHTYTHTVHYYMCTVQHSIIYFYVNVKMLMFRGKQK